MCIYIYINTHLNASVQAQQRNSILVHLSLFILVVLQACNNSRVVIWSGAGCAWHEDGVKLAVRVQRAANCIESQTRLTLMCCACQVGTFGCAALVGLRTSDLSSTLWAASCCTVVGNSDLVLLVVFNLMIDQPSERRTLQKTQANPLWLFLFLGVGSIYVDPNIGPNMKYRKSATVVSCYTPLKLSLHVQQ